MIFRVCFKNRQFNFSCCLLGFLIRPERKAKMDLYVFLLLLNMKVSLANVGGMLNGNLSFH